MRKLASILVISSFCFQVFAADGTVSQVTTKLGPIIKNTFSWASNAGTNYVSGQATTAIRGELLRVVYDPIVAGTRPTNTYTIAMLDGNGIDLLAGTGANLATGTVTTVRPGLVTTVTPTTNIAPFAINDLVTITVTNSGFSKKATLIIYTR